MTGGHDHMATRKQLLNRAREIGATVVIDRDVVSVTLPRYVVSLVGPGLHYFDFDVDGFPISLTYANALEWMSELGECPDKGHCEFCDSADIHHPNHGRQGRR